MLESARPAVTQIARAMLPAWRRLSRQRAGLLAAGVAFYTLLSLVPAMVALVAMAGLWMSPQDIMTAAERARSLMPEEAAKILLSQLDQIASAPSGGLQLALFLGFAVALYSASRAVGSLVDGVSEVRDAKPEAGWLATLVHRLGLTFLLLCIAALTLASILVVPVVVGVALRSSQAAPWIALLRWPIVAGFILIGIAAIYRSAKHTSSGGAETSHRFLTTGAIVAAVVILPASIGFSVYIESFTDYNASFGALGGVVTLLLWLWLSAFIVIGGAALDVEMAESGSRPDPAQTTAMPQGGTRAAGEHATGAEPVMDNRDDGRTGARHPHLQ